MTDFKIRITRRDFLRGATYAGLAAAVGLPLNLSLGAEEAEGPRVVLIRDPLALDNKGNVNAGAINKMLDQAVATLFNEEKPREAWKQLFGSDDIVGIKSNEWSYLPTPHELEQALKNRLLEAGVAEKNIGIDDRNVLGNDVFLKSTALINVRPLRTHHWCGIGGCIKNYIMFVPRPWEYHDNSCADLATIWNKPLVKDKTKLNILVLLQPLFYGIGPHHFDKTYVWDYRGLLVGTDPVALDAVGIRLIEAKRRAYFNEDRPILPPPHHVAYAEIKHKLGISDLRKIKLIKLGWQEDVLI